ALPANLPEPVRALIRACLLKDRRERIGDLSTARFLLSQASAVTTAGGAGRLQRRSIWRRVIPLVASVFVGAGVTAILLGKQKPTLVGTVTRFAIALPQGQQLVLPRQAL